MNHSMLNFCVSILCRSFARSISVNSMLLGVQGMLDNISRFGNASDSYLGLDAFVNKLRIAYEDYDCEYN